MRAAPYTILLIGIAVVAGVSGNQRIVGGSVTTIEQYPFQVATLITYNMVTYDQLCGGTILNARSILSAAHCHYYNAAAARWRVRVGSTWANSGGIVHNVIEIIIHPSFNIWTGDHDINILRLGSVIGFNNQARPASIAGSSYNLADNQVVWAIGWGLQSSVGPPSQQLRHVQVWSVNQRTCRTRYAELGWYISNNMLCSGWLDVGGRGQCQGDSGGPLIHNGVVVGVTSWGDECAHDRYPVVNARVSSHATWIQANA